MVAQGEGDTKGCTYYEAHNQAFPNDSQTHVLYLNTFQGWTPGGKRHGPHPSQPAGLQCLTS